MDWKSAYLWAQITPQKSHLSRNVQKVKMVVVAVGPGVPSDCNHSNSKPWIRRLGHTVCST